MKFKNVRNIIHNLLWIKDEKKVLGRWNMETCDRKTNYKIDLSNEDHCGPCGNTSKYIIPKVDQMTTNIKIDLNLPKYHRED
jgi:hypothetical protein